MPTITADAPEADQVGHQLDRALQADRLEGVVGAARHDRLDGAGDVAVAAHGVRRPDVARLLELGVLHVHGDDRMGARERCAHDDGEPDAAAADHDDGGPRLDPGRVDDRADAGRDGAADQAGDLERHVGGNRHDGAGGHDGSLRERADGEVLVDLGAVRAAEAQRAVVERRVVDARLAAGPRAPAHAGAAVTAGIAP